MNSGSAEKAPFYQAGDGAANHQAERGSCSRGDWGLTREQEGDKVLVLIDTYRRFIVWQIDMRKSKVRQTLELARRMGIIRPRDLRDFGIPLDYLWQLHRRGLLSRLGRGLYALAGADITERHSFAEACKRAPHGVVCLLSALSFHGFTTQAPFEVWLAISVKARSPKPAGLRLRIVRFSGKALASGIEQHNIEGVNVRVYSPVKTVADCFKYRNKIGLDVALEALRDCWRDRRATMDDLWRYAKACRVSNVMRPYLESLV